MNAAAVPARIGREFGMQLIGGVLIRQQGKYRWSPGRLADSLNPLRAEMMDQLGRLERGINPALNRDKELAHRFAEFIHGRAEPVEIRISDRREHFLM